MHGDTSAKEHTDTRYSHQRGQTDSDACYSFISIWHHTGQQARLSAGLPYQFNETPPLTFLTSFSHFLWRTMLLVSLILFHLWTKMCLSSIMFEISRQTISQTQNKILVVLYEKINHLYHYILYFGVNASSCRHLKNNIILLLLSKNPELRQAFISKNIMIIRRRLWEIFIFK